MRRNPFVVDLAACQDAHKRMADIPSRVVNNLMDDEERPGPKRKAKPMPVVIPTFVDKRRKRAPRIVKIEADIPIPRKGNGRLGTTKYPALLALKVGESFAVPAEYGGRLGNAAEKIGKRTGRQFLRRTRAENGEKITRIWRVK